MKLFAILGVTAFILSISCKKVEDGSKLKQVEITSSSIESYEYTCNRPETDFSFFLSKENGLWFISSSGIFGRDEIELTKSAVAVNKKNNSRVYTSIDDYLELNLVATHIENNSYRLEFYSSEFDSDNYTTTCTKRNR